MSTSSDHDTLTEAGNDENTGSRLLPPSRSERANEVGEEPRSIDGGNGHEEPGHPVRERRDTRPVPTALNRAENESRWTDGLLSLFASIPAYLDESEIVSRFAQRAAKLLPGVHLSIRLTTAADGKSSPPRSPASGAFESPIAVDDVNVGSIASADAAVSPMLRVRVAQLATALGTLLQNANQFRVLEAQRVHLANVIEHTCAPILVIEPNRKVRQVNPAFLALSRLPPGEIIGRDVIEFVPTKLRKGVLDSFARALKGQPVTDVEIHWTRQSGSTARLSIDTTTVMDPDGQADVIVAIGRDLSQVRRLEEQVIQAEKLATLGQLAAGVVHELNNPLTSISIYSEYLLAKSQSHPQSDPSDTEKLRRIVENGERMLRFTRDLVTYARPSSEQPDTVRVHDVLDQALVFCEHVVRRNNTCIERDYSAKLPAIRAIKGQLHQVFINLITNACHAMSGGDGCLRVSADYVAGADTVTVRLQDNGPGIPPDHRELVFEPFFSTKREGEGTGLGLSIVRKIVQQHAGSVRIESQTDQGTTFEIELPIAGISAEQS